MRLIFNCEHRAEDNVLTPRFMVQEVVRTLAPDLQLQFLNVLLVLRPMTKLARVAAIETLIEIQSSGHLPILLPLAHLLRCCRRITDRQFLSMVDETEKIDAP